MKREWKTPKLEVLDLSQTFAGPGIRDLDETYVDEDETVHLHKS